MPYLYSRRSQSFDYFCAFLSRPSIILVQARATRQESTLRTKVILSADVLTTYKSTHFFCMRSLKGSSDIYACINQLSEVR